MLPKKNIDVLKVTGVIIRKGKKGEPIINKRVTIPSSRTDIQPGDFIKFKKVEII
jgi:hypothetical protein